MPVDKPEAVNTVARLASFFINFGDLKKVSIPQFFTETLMKEDADLTTPVKSL